MTDELKSALTKVPAVTLGFWIIKILATTFGETAGDAVSMSWLGETTPDAATSFWQGGYLIGTAIFLSILAVLAFVQIRAKSFNPWLYWATIIASTTAGTTMADFATRSLGIGYAGGSVLLLGCVVVSLFAWRPTWPPSWRRPRRPWPRPSPAGLDPTPAAPTRLDCAASAGHSCARSSDHLPGL